MRNGRLLMSWFNQGGFEIRKALNIFNKNNGAKNYKNIQNLIEFMN